VRIVYSTYAEAYTFQRLDAVASSSRRHLVCRPTVPTLCSCFQSFLENLGSIGRYSEGSLFPGSVLCWGRGHVLIRFTCCPEIQKLAGKI